jgi:K+/H+ antiporter YhaU regulatory subunit KhtT
VREIGFRENFGVNVILIQKHPPGSEEGEEKEEEATVNQLPMPDYMIEENDVLLVVGKGEDIERLRNQ